MFAFACHFGEMIVLIAAARSGGTAEWRTQKSWQQGTQNVGKQKHSRKTSNEIVVAMYGFTPSAESTFISERGGP